MVVEITRQRLQYLLHYNPETGVFRWRVSQGRMPVGSIAGACSHGRATIGVDGIRYFAANLAWLYMTDEWSELEVDHKDGNPLNDRWENLRLATQTENNANAKLRVDNTSGSRGVSWKQDKQKWKAYVNINGKQIHCGYFDTIEEAKAARDAKASLLHGEFARFDNLSKGDLQ